MRTFATLERVAVHAGEVAPDLLTFAEALAPVEVMDRFYGLASITGTAMAEQARPSRRE